MTDLPLTVLLIPPSPRLLVSQFHVQRLGAFGRIADVEPGVLPFLRRRPIAAKKLDSAILGPRLPEFLVPDAGAPQPS